MADEVNVEIVNRQRLIEVDNGRIADVAIRALHAIEVSAAALTIGFLRDKGIRQLNRQYRGKDHPTDVLSFPEQAGAGFEAGTNLGDILISADTAVRQAAEAGLSVDREIDELVIHGILHLCGYDHATDRGQMNRLELKLRSKILGADPSGKTQAKGSVKSPANARLVVKR